MSPKSSAPQAASLVSQVLMSDSQELEAGFTPAVSPEAEKLLDVLRHSLDDLRARYLEERILLTSGKRLADRNYRTV